MLTDGAVFVSCNHRLPDPADPAKRKTLRCGQTSHIVIREGVAYVAPVPSQLFQKWRKTYPRVEEVYQELEVIVRRDETPIAIEPRFPCLRCTRSTALSELVYGRCPQCATTATTLEERIPA